MLTQVASLAVRKGIHPPVPAVAGGEITPLNVKRGGRKATPTHSTCHLAYHLASGVFGLKGGKLPTTQKPISAHRARRSSSGRQAVAAPTEVKWIHRRTSLPGTCRTVRSAPSPSVHGLIQKRIPATQDSRIWLLTSNKCVVMRRDRSAAILLLTRK